MAAAAAIVMANQRRDEEERARRQQQSRKAERRRLSSVATSRFDLDEAAIARDEIGISSDGSALAVIADSKVPGLDDNLSGISAVSAESTEPSNASDLIAGLGSELKTSARSKSGASVMSAMSTNTTSSSGSGGRTAKRKSASAVAGHAGGFSTTDVTSGGIHKMRRTGSLFNQMSLDIAYENSQMSNGYGHHRRHSQSQSTANNRGQGTHSAHPSLIPGLSTIESDHHSKSVDEPEDEREQRDNLKLTRDQLRFGLKERRKTFIIDPDWPERVIWDFFVVVFVAYNAIEIPLRVGYQTDLPQAYLTATTNLFDVFFFLDILINFVTTFMGRDGNLVNDYRVIAKKYVKSWFWIDFLSALPLDTMATWFANDISALKVLGPLEMLRLLRCAKIVKILRKYTKRVGYGVRILLSLGWFVLWAHVFGCTYHWLGLVQEDDDHPNWLRNSDLIGVKFKKRFSWSFYWAVTTMTTVGYGDISATTDTERIFLSFIMLCSALGYATIFGSVSLSLSQMGADYSNYRSKVDSLEKYLQDLGLPKYFREDVMNYNDYLWEKNHGLMDQLDELPLRVQSEARTLAHREMLNKSSLFVFLPSPTIVLLTSFLQLTVALPKEPIITKGSRPEKVFFIKRGQVKIYQKVSKRKNKALCYLEDGSYFGELPILFRQHKKKGWKEYRNNARALGYCDLYTIDKKDLLYLLHQYPPLRRLMWHVAWERHLKTEFYYDDALIDRIMMSALKDPDYADYLIVPYQAQRPEIRNNPSSTVTNTALVATEYFQTTDAATIHKVIGEEEPSQQGAPAPADTVAVSGEVSSGSIMAVGKDALVVVDHTDDPGVLSSSQNSIDITDDSAHPIPQVKEEEKEKESSKPSEPQNVVSYLSSFQCHCWNRLKDEAYRVFDQTQDSSFRRMCSTMAEVCFWCYEKEDEPKDPVRLIVEAVEQLRHEFEIIADGEQTLDPEAFYTRFEGVGYLTRGELEKAWNEIDKDGSGDIDVDEIIEVCLDVAKLHPGIDSEELLTRSLHYVLEKLSSDPQSDEEKKEGEDAANTALLSGDGGAESSPDPADIPRVLRAKTMPDLIAQVEKTMETLNAVTAAATPIGIATNAAAFAAAADDDAAASQARVSLAAAAAATDAGTIALHSAAKTVNDLHKQLTHMSLAIQDADDGRSDPAKLTGRRSTKKNMKLDHAGGSVTSLEDESDSKSSRHDMTDISDDDEDIKSPLLSEEDILMSLQNEKPTIKNGRLKAPSSFRSRSADETSVRQMGSEMASVLAMQAKTQELILTQLAGLTATVARLERSLGAAPAISSSLNTPVKGGDIAAFGSGVSETRVESLATGMLTPDLVGGGSSMIPGSEDSSTVSAAHAYTGGSSEDDTPDS